MGHAATLTPSKPNLKGDSVEPVSWAYMVFCLLAAIAGCLWCRCRLPAPPAEEGTPLTSEPAAAMAANFGHGHGSCQPRTDRSNVYRNQCTGPAMLGVVLHSGAAAIVMLQKQ